MLYALKYAGSKQLMLRRTFPELRRSLVLNSLVMYPETIGKYTESIKKWTFKNGSSIEFGYCDSENDVNQYQSAEYDCIRFDELTHFTEFQYTYLISRIRGVNNFPKQIKSSSNPGSVGHSWVKARFIDVAPPNTIYTDNTQRTRVFIPASVYENKFLMDADPEYIRRLEQLPEYERRTLLLGEWNIFAGQYFQEFDTNVHVIQPFVIPDHWRKYFVMDYGLDMLAGYFIAVDTQNKAYVYKEIYQSNLIISDAAKVILDNVGKDKIYQWLAPPDMWNRRQETGKSAAELFQECGIVFNKTDNSRVQGWLNVKEWLKVYKDEQGIDTAQLQIFSNCLNLIRCFPQVLRDKRDPNDVSSEPHELTHSLDAIRGFIAGRPYKTLIPQTKFNNQYQFGNKNNDNGGFVTW